MSVLFELHRARQVERVFRSAEALVGAAFGHTEPPPAELGHMDVHGRMVSALKNAGLDDWIRLDDSTIARRFEARAADIERPIEG